MAILYQFVIVLVILSVTSAYPYKQFRSPRSRRLLNPRQIYPSQSMLLRDRRQGNPLDRERGTDSNKNPNAPLNPEPVNQNPIKDAEETAGVDSSYNPAQQADSVLPSQDQSALNNQHQDSNFQGGAQDRFAPNSRQLFNGNKEPNIPYGLPNPNPGMLGGSIPSFGNPNNQDFRLHPNPYNLDQSQFLPNPNPYAPNPNPQFRPNANPPLEANSMESQQNSQFVGVNRNPHFIPETSSRFGPDQGSRFSPQEQGNNRFAPERNPEYRPEPNIPDSVQQKSRYNVDQSSQFLPNQNPEFGMFQPPHSGPNNNPVPATNQNPPAFGPDPNHQFGANQNPRFNENGNQFLADRNVPNNLYMPKADSQFPGRFPYSPEQHTPDNVQNSPNSDITNNLNGEYQNPGFGDGNPIFPQNIGEEPNKEVSSPQNPMLPCDKSRCEEPKNCMNVTESEEQCCPTCETHGCQCEGYQYYDCVLNGFEKGMVPEGKSYSVDSGSTVCQCPKGGGTILCSYRGFGDSSPSLFEQTSSKLLCPEQPKNCIQTLTRADGCIECLGIGCVSDDGTKHQAGESISKPPCMTCYCPAEGGDFFCGTDPNCQEPTDTRHSSLESTQRVLRDPLQNEGSENGQEKTVQGYDNTGYDTRFLQADWNSFDSKSSQSQHVAPALPSNFNQAGDDVETPPVVDPRVPTQSETNKMSGNYDQNIHPAMQNEFHYGGYNQYGYNSGNQYPNNQFGYNQRNPENGGVGGVGMPNNMGLPDQANRFYQPQQPIYTGFYQPNQNFNGYPRVNTPADPNEKLPENSDAPRYQQIDQSSAGGQSSPENLNNNRQANDIKPKKSNRDVDSNYGTVALRPELYDPNFPGNQFLNHQMPSQNQPGGVPSNFVIPDSVESVDPGFVNESSSFENVLSACCYQGKQWALSHMTCRGIQVTVNSYAQTCAVAQEKCCLETKSQEHCQAGITTARSMLACTKPYESTAEDHCGRNGYKSCCDCCALGLKAYVLSLTCDMNILGETCNAAFVECCTKGRLLQPTNDFNLTPLSSIASSLPTSSSPEDPEFKEPLCLTDNRCDQVCTDSEAGAECSCRTGYKLNRDQTTCDDVNECVLGTHTCKIGEFCLNNLGGFTCQRSISCGTGYELTGKNTCNDIDECELELDNCGTTLDCVNLRGSFRCVPKLCDAGYFTDATGGCIDIDECRAGDYTCPPRSRCQNNVGSYSCVCPAGLNINEAGDECIDADECALGIDDCGDGSTCMNTDGSFTCVRPKLIECYAGFQPNLNHTACIDIDECLEGTHKCNEGSTCINTQGGFKCEDPLRCESGMRPSHNQRYCIDIDECADEELHRCGAGGNCVNAPGSYSCECKTGFEKSRNATGVESCVDINECELGTTRKCTYRCENTEGSYRCVCPSGYLPIEYGKSCDDINECILVGRNNCSESETCFNTRGSYRCVNLTCPTNYGRLANKPRRPIVKCWNRHSCFSPRCHHPQIRSIMFRHLALPSIPYMSRPIPLLRFGKTISASDTFKVTIIDGNDGHEFEIGNLKNKVTLFLINTILGPWDTILQISVEEISPLYANPQFTYIKVYVYVSPYNM